MNRLAMGAALGGLAVYLYDPELGEERRERLFSLWQENRGSAVQAGRAVSQAAESARPLARRMTKAVGRREWAEAFDRGRPPIGLTKLIGAAVIGGTLVYLLDPVEGAERRQRPGAVGSRLIRPPGPPAPIRSRPRGGQGRPRG